MTLDDEARAGYWPSPWPAEDGGPRRPQAPPAGSGFRLDGPWAATSRDLLGANMVMLREPGEVFVQGSTLGFDTDTTAWVERIDPVTLEPLVRSPDLPGGPFWAGGVAAHANGSLYVTYGTWCHRLDAEALEPTAAARLPRDRPYNSLLVLPDGTLVMKDFGGGAGVHAMPAGEGSELVALDPDDLSVRASLLLPEGSIARLSALPAGDARATATVVVVGDTHLHTAAWDPTAGTLTPAGPPRRYRTLPGQTFGWDAVVSAGSAWFLDDGEGTTAFGPSFAGKGVSESPLHLVRVDLDDPEAPPVLTEVCGQPGGIVANPPLIDAGRGLALAYDSGNGVVAGFRFPADAGEPLEPVWRRHQHHAGHMLFDQERGLALTFDYDHDAGADHAVVLEITTGDEVSRAPTGSPLQAVVFPAPGWADDVYTVTFSTLTRLHRP